MAEMTGSTLAGIVIALGVVNLAISLAAWVRAGEAARRESGRIHRGARVRRRRRH